MPIYSNIKKKFNIVFYYLLFNLYLYNVFIRHKITKLVIAETEEKNKIEENLNSIENEFTNIAESKKGKVEILRCLNE